MFKTPSILLMHLVVLCWTVVAVLPLPMMRITQSVNEITERAEIIEETTTSQRRFEVPLPGGYELRKSNSPKLPISPRLSRSLPAGAVPNGHFLSSGHCAPLLT